MLRFLALALSAAAALGGSAGCHNAQVERRCQRREVRSLRDCRCQRTPREKVGEAARRLANSDIVTCVVVPVGIVGRFFHPR